MSDVWHLMGGALGILDACETAPMDESLLVTANEENVTCPECVKIIKQREESTRD